MLGQTWSIWCTAIQCSGLSLPLSASLDPRLSCDVRQGSSSRRAGSAACKVASLSGDKIQPMIESNRGLVCATVGLQRDNDHLVMSEP